MLAQQGYIAFAVSKARIEHTEGLIRVRKHLFLYAILSPAYSMGQNYWCKSKKCNVGISGPGGGLRYWLTLLMLPPPDLIHLLFHPPLPSYIPSMSLFCPLTTNLPIGPVLIALVVIKLDLVPAGQLWPSCWHSLLSQCCKCALWHVCYTYAPVHLNWIGPWVSSSVCHRINLWHCISASGKVIWLPFPSPTRVMEHLPFTGNFLYLCGIDSPLSI